MSEEAQGKILRGTVLPDSSKKDWIIGSFIEIDGSAEVYEAAQYHGNMPGRYPALIKLKPHGDKALSSEIEFLKDHADTADILKWLAKKDVHYEYLGLPYFWGSGQKVATAGTNLDFLVLERYGSNLETLLAKHKNIFPTPTVLKLALHILGVIEYLHQRDVVYGNIRACNIRVDLFNPCVIYLLPQFHTADECDGNAVTFWSREQHDGDTTKRGDLESMLYNLIHWSGGILPWINTSSNEARIMKRLAFEDPKQFLKDAFPICKCPNPSLCMAARKCVVSGEPVAASKCLRAFADLMEQLVSMGKTHNGAPNYKAIEKSLKRRLLNMYQVPTSKLEFSLPTILVGDEDVNEKWSRGRRKRVDSYLPGLEIAANVLALIIAENCSSFGEVHTFDTKSCGVIDVLLQMKVSKSRSVIKPIIQKAWKKNTQKLRTTVVELWRSKGLKPGSYKTWRKRKNEQEVSINESKPKKRASTEAKTNTTQMANHESTVREDHADERNLEEPIVPRHTNVDATNTHLSHQSTSQNQKVGLAHDSSQRKRSFSPSRSRDSISSNLFEVPQKSHLSISLSSPSKSNRIQSPVSSIGSSGFSSLRCDQVNFHPDDLSPLRMSDQSFETVYRQLSEETAPEPREKAGKTDKRVTEGRRSVFLVEGQWHDTYELLKTWLDDKEQTLVFGPIPSEPQLVAEQVKRVRMLCDDYRMRDDRIRQLTIVLESMPPESNDAEKLKRIKQRWEFGLARSENHARELGEASLGRLRDALEDVSSKLDQLPNKTPEEQLLRKVESLAKLMEGQQTLLTNTGKVIEQLTQVVSDSTINSDLHAEFQGLNNFYEGLKRKIEAKKAEIERSIENERHFDDSCREILVWLINELEGISEKLLVSADYKTLQKQHEDYKVVDQRIMARETEVIELLKKGLVLSRQDNLENRNSQKSLLNAVKTSWNRLVTQSRKIDKKFQTCVEACNKYDEASSLFSQWLDNAEEKLENLKLACVGDIKSQLKEVSSLSEEAHKELDAFEEDTKLGDPFFAACGEEESYVLKNKLIAMKERWRKLNNDLLKRTQSLDDMDRRFVGLKKSLNQLDLRMDEAVLHDPLRGLARDANFLNRIKEAREKYSSLRNSLDAICQLANELVSMAGEQRVDTSNLSGEVNRVAARFKSLNIQFNNRCDEFLEITSFKKELEEPIPSITTEQKQDIKPTVLLPPTTCSSEEVIDLVSSSDNEDFATDASKVEGPKQHSNEQSLEKKNPNIDSDRSDDGVNSMGKRNTKLSKKHVNRISISLTSDSEPDCCEKIEKKKNSVKRKTDSDPDWNSLSDANNINSDLKCSPRFVFKKKKYRGKIRS